MNPITIVALLLFLLGGFSISLIINGLLLRFAKSLGIRNHQDFVIRWSNEVKPSLGGISFFISFLFTLIFYSIVFGDSDIFRNTQLLGFFGASSLAFFMGLADDSYDTRPLLKLLAQIVCGLFITTTGTMIHLFDNNIADSIVTIIWVVGVMNSINMIDNMDGIASTVSLFILIACLGGTFLISGIIPNIWVVMMLSMIGTLIGFLYYNWHPAKLFMGDAGSQFIGFVLAFFAVGPLWNSANTYQEHSWIGMLICLVAFTPAAVDTLTVFINRIAKKQSPMVGGKDHTTHHLVYKGLSEKKVLIRFLYISLTSSILSFLMIFLVSEKNSFFACLFSAFFFVIFYFLFRNTKKYKQIENGK